MNSPFQDGINLRKQVLGEEYVDDSIADQSAVDPLQRLITEYAWGSVWTRSQLPLQVRSLSTIALLTALNRPHELSMHIRGAIRNGCTVEEVREMILHCALYCGIPAALNAMALANEIFGARWDEGMVDRDRPSPRPISET
jgi:4-carboxymuconolactone decarboxylase